jgi:hypothetical protein
MISDDFHRLRVRDHLHDRLAADSRGKAGVRLVRQPFGPHIEWDSHGPGQIVGLAKARSQIILANIIQRFSL